MGLAIGVGVLAFLLENDREGAEWLNKPVDFHDVLLSGPGDSSVPGGMLGSSYRLRDELISVAPALGIRLDEGRLSDEEAARVDDLACSNEGLFREFCAWLALYEAARVSIELKTAIVFS